jgi:Family of unknown function (DUF5675)
MNLTLVREPSSGESTFGVLFVDGVFQCFTLEDVVRPAKIAGSTAIPAGRYTVRVTWSPRFKRMLPLVENVPGFEGIRFHAGNSAKDTDGCILPGTGRTADRVVGSRAAFDALLAKLTGEARLTIVSVEAFAGLGGLI